MALAATFVTSCTDSDFTAIPDPTPITEGDRTVLVYISAQNSLGSNGFQRADSLEMANGARYIDDNDRFLVYIDDANSPRIYRFTKNQTKPELVKQYTRDLDSSDPETLKEVLAWTKQNFPAQEYGLVMWSHSDGWLPSPNVNYQTKRSFGIDVGTGGDMDLDVDKTGQIGTGMNIDDMAEAIESTGIKLKYIFFDSCLMQCIETNYTLRNATEYVIASPISTPGYGSHYTNELKQGFFSDNPADIARIYYDNVTSGDYSNLYGNDGFVISAIKTDELQALADITKDLLPSHIAGSEEPDMTGVMPYHTYSYYYFYRPEFYDAGSAMYRILGEEDYTLWREQLDKAVVYKAASTRYWIGPYNSNYAYRDKNYAAVSMFVPQSKYTDNASACLYGDLNKAFRQTSWYTAAGWAATGW